MNAIDTRIIELHESGLSIGEISSRFGRKYNNRVVAGIVAKSEITIDKELFLVIPSSMNYDFKMIKDFGLWDQKNN